MSPERTESLLSAAHAAYNTRAEDLLLAALAMALERWSGSPVVHVDLESHGRPDDVTGIDLSRTVGWFTAVRTVDVDARTTGNLGSLITRVKERLRTDPALRAEGHAPVLFNYVGRLRSPDTGALGPIAFLHDSSRDPRNARPYVLEVNAAVRGDRLELDLVYSSALHDTATIERIATGIEEALNALVDHCLGAEQRFTPSDFPEAGMDQSELDEFLGSL
jgi:non-ribosomal peptide synthase protein (TIGR01720 family)